MKKNNKGFTLIELLAVVVVLIIILLIAFNKIKSSTQKSHMNAIKSSALTYVKAVRNLIAEDVATNESLDYGVFTTSDFETLGISISGKKPTSGYFTIADYKIKSFCLEYENSYYLTESSSGISDVNNGKCEVDSIVIDFAYTGSQQEFTASKTGIYKLEVWGASGGLAGRATDVKPGYGSYSVAYLNLNKDDIVYIYIGGAGGNGLNGNGAAGGYNGGGAGGDGHNKSNDYPGAGGGGGASHIAYEPGLLSALSDKISSIIIVAGGGGGASAYYTCSTCGMPGGSGGGAKGVDGTMAISSIVATGGTQESGYMFGQGGDGRNGTSSGSSAYEGAGGGGGGYYGGKSQTLSGYQTDSSGGGGSGYIGNKQLMNKMMYCYNCSESPNANTKTKSTTCVNKNPTPNCAKIGDGHAKITFVG